MLASGFLRGERPTATLGRCRGSLSSFVCLWSRRSPGVGGRVELR